MPGGRGPLAVLGRCHQEAPRRLVNHRHLPFANRFIAMLHASGAASTLQRRGIPHTRHSCECASVPPDPKAHFCDRHHIASAMAELVSYLSIIPHMRWFDVPSPQNAETVLLVVEGDALDETRQHLAVGWFGLNFHEPRHRWGVSH
jgi:hypothetical protein